MPQNEGQHLQDVYLRTNQLRGVFQYGYREKGYLTEASPLVTTSNREELLAAWSPYWRTDATHLVEKSPRHSTMTRFLQAIFAPAPSMFLATIRHPLACAHFYWSRRFRKGLPGGAEGCGDAYIDHWLQVYKILLEDAKSLRHFRLVHFEIFMGEGLGSPLSVAEGEALTQRMTDALFDALALPSNVQLEFGPASPPKPNKAGSNDGGDGGDDDDASAADAANSEANTNRNRKRRGNADPSMKDTQPSPADSGNQRRTLLEYHGDWHHLKLTRGSSQAWVDEWTSAVDMDSPQCKAVIDKYESRLNSLGYSMRDLRRVTLPVGLRPSYLFVPDQWKKQEA